MLFIANNFNGEIPKAELPQKFKDKLFNLYCDVGDKIEEGKFNSALNDIMSMVKETNKFFDDEKPWITIKENKEKCKATIYICLYIIANLSNLLEPFMPFTAENIRSFLNIKNKVWMPIDVKVNKIDKFKILFKRIDKEKINEEIELLKNKKY